MVLCNVFGVTYYWSRGARSSWNVRGTCTSVRLSRTAFLISLKQTQTKTMEISKMDLGTSAGNSSVADHSRKVTTCIF